MMAAFDTGSEWRLQDLLAGLVDITVPDDLVINGICADSREVEPGNLFMVTSRAADVAFAYAEEAARRGAIAVLASNSHRLPPLIANLPVLAIQALPETVGQVASRYFSEPSQQMNVLGVTGTNGKTSVSQYIAHGLDHMLAPPVARSCGVLGTLGYGLRTDLELGRLTTPDALTVHSQLARILALGAKHVVMEVSSHGLDQARISGVAFDVAVFTNLSRDHLDYHPDMHAYGEAKRRLFLRPGLRAAVVNSDDSFGREILHGVPDGVRSYAFGMETIDTSQFRVPVTPVSGRIIAAHRYSLTLAVHTPSAEAEFSAPLLGTFNASNLLAAIGAMLACGFSLQQAVQSLSSLPAVPGRMERLGAQSGEPLVVVDYSHTPDSLRTALGALREQLDGELWCVFGCGGDRDRGKRRQMGEAAAELADHVVVTDDNPRRESSERIVADIYAGIPSNVDTVIIRDRADAIRHAVSCAQPEDTVLVAGKGHEPYQEVDGVRRPFSDAAVVRIALRERHA